MVEFAKKSLLSPVVYGPLTKASAQVRDSMSDGLESWLLDMLAMNYGYGPTESELKLIHSHSWGDDE